MRIAFTYNLQRTDSVEEAEFDSPETVAAVTAALQRLGHEVQGIDVDGPVAALVAALVAARPDLVFNTAEGRSGRDREAFFPALFARLGLDHTGGDAHACLVSLDKHLSKMVVGAAGVPTPGWRLVLDPDDPTLSTLRLPVIIKPNFEGSSKGVDQDSVVERVEDLRPTLSRALTAFSEGVLVEEFIVGRDVTVPWLELASPETGGALAPCEYVFSLPEGTRRAHDIYDYQLKHEFSDAVSVRTPADVPEAVSAGLRRHALAAARALGLRDLGRLDFRLDDLGRAWFIEANALPSLEPGASLYEAAALEGIESMDAVLDLVVRSAVSRRERPRPAASPGRRRRRLRVGLTYNLKREGVGLERDGEAEFDSQSTVDAILEAIAVHGHEPVALEATTDLLRTLPEAGVDVVFNIAEGIQGRNREALVPALLEFLHIPYTGSDPATLSMTLDKDLAKRMVAQAGVAVAPSLVMRTGRERVPASLRFPAIIKPVAEGSSKGIHRSSVVRSADELRGALAEGLARYPTGVLVETFLPGREFTVGLLGNARPRALPPMEIVFDESAGEHPVYSFVDKLSAQTPVRFVAPAEVDPRLRQALTRAARQAFLALHCRDVARVDFRLDADGQVCFVECNPLPGLAPGFSDLCTIAASAGMSYDALVGAILRPALRRWARVRRGVTAFA